MRAIKFQYQLIFVFSLILLFYFWTATKGEFVFEFPHASYYNQLTDAFFKGQLHLLVDVPQGLLQLPDPYDSSANREYRINNLHDLSLYKNMIYLYFGATPVITLYMPYRLLISPNMHDGFAVLFFMFGSLVFSILILLDLRKKYFKELPNWIINLSAVVISIANMGPYILRRPSVYEVATACGCFFLTGAVYLFCKAYKGNNFNLKTLSWGSLFLGLAIGARPNLLLDVIILPFILYYIYKGTSGKEKKLKTDVMLALFLPVAFCILLIMAYNYFRFDSVFENGFSYQLRENQYGGKISLSNFLSNLNSYLFECPYIDSHFPFFHAPLWEPPPEFPQRFERIIGIIPRTPFLLLILLAPYFYLNTLSGIKKEQKNKEIVFPYYEFYLVFLPGLINLLFLLVFKYVNIRYTVDFSTLLVLAACIIWFYFDLKLANSSLRRILRTTAIFLAVVSTLSSMAISIEGCYYGLVEQNPELYDKLESFFSPVANFLRNF